MKDFTEYIKQARYSNTSLSQVRASLAIAGNKYDVANWEIGQSLPRPEELIAMARVYEISLDSLWLRYVSARLSRLTDELQTIKKEVFKEGSDGA